MQVAECVFQCEASRACSFGLRCGQDGYCHRDSNTNHCPMVVADGGTCTVDGGVVCGGPYNYVFVTSQTLTPGSQYQPGGNSFASLDDADQICNDLAKTAGLAGTFKAWLSDSQHHAYDRLKTARGWIRPDGRPFANSIDDLASGKIFYPIRLDESQVDRLDAAAATGTDESGHFSQGDWASTTASYTFGHASATTSDWTATQYIGMGATHVYCFGVDWNRELVVQGQPGPIAFLSRDVYPLTTNGGLAAADSFCASQAAQNGLGTNYRALLSTTTAAASSSSRFSPTASWVRPDGIPWANANGLSNGIVLTALNVDQFGNYHGTVNGTWLAVWTGGDLPGTVRPANATCENWTSAQTSATVGLGNFSDHFFNWSSGFGCNHTDTRLYCLAY